MLTGKRKGDGTIIRTFLFSATEEKLEKNLCSNCIIVLLDFRISSSNGFKQLPLFSRSCSSLNDEEEGGGKGGVGRGSMGWIGWAIGRKRLTKHVDSYLSRVLSRARASDIGYFFSLLDGVW